ncbi:hypothetical protein FRX31_025818 [Thalictrum thalictroides]|uniref:Uncharacterized protein n=1 Tax=Thalictrum thalictroides TaxID=46969 RepID=A0A7J6VKC3_THATH|nr:hypothetical protein FRX31_025818 [Thalictrum thalictroides]
MGVSRFTGIPPVIPGMFPVTTGQLINLQTHQAYTRSFDCGLFGLDDSVMMLTLVQGHHLGVDNVRVFEGNQNIEWAKQVSKTKPSFL